MRGKREIGTVQKGKKGPVSHSNQSCVIQEEIEWARGIEKDPREDDRLIEEAELQRARELMMRVKAYLRFRR